MMIKSWNDNNVNVALYLYNWSCVLLFNILILKFRIINHFHKKFVILL